MRPFSKQPGRAVHPFRSASHFSCLGAAALVGAALAAPAMAFDRPLPVPFPFFGPPLAAHPAYRTGHMLLHPREIADILIEEHGFQAVRRPRLAGPLYLAEGIDRRGNLVEIVLDPVTGRIINGEVIVRRRDKARLAHAQPFANRPPIDRRGPDPIPLPPRRPQDLTGRPPSDGRINTPLPPDAPARAEGSPTPAVPVAPRPRFADPRPRDEPDQPPPFARGVTPVQPAP